MTTVLYHITSEPLTVVFSHY